MPSVKLKPISIETDGNFDIILFGRLEFWTISKFDVYMQISEISGSGRGNGGVNVLIYAMSQGAVVFKVKDVGIMASDIVDWQVTYG